MGYIQSQKVYIFRERNREAIGCLSQTHPLGIEITTGACAETGNQTSNQPFGLWDSTQQLSHTGQGRGPKFFKGKLHPALFSC